MSDGMQILHNKYWQRLISNDFPFSFFFFGGGGRGLEGEEGVGLLFIINC